jgi:hypothetical protein
MHKHIYVLVLFTAVFCINGFSQAPAPPNINIATDTATNISCNIYISFSPNDTGVISANIVLQQGTGNSVFDSTFILPAGDTSNVEFSIDSLIPCTQYQLLTIMSNDRAVGLQVNPLLNISTLCTPAGISSINENSYSLIALPKSVEVRADEVPAGARIDIYDVTGKLVLNTAFTQSVQQIPFNRNAGIYLLRITGNGQSLYTTRFAIF